MAIQLSKNGNAVKFDFDDNSHYLNDGTIEVPVNSLTLVTDESDMFTFKKAASDDIFISGLYSEIGMSKAELIAWYKDNMVGSTGGGGGVTSGEVQTMIDESVSGLSDDISTVSGATESLHSAVTELSRQVETDEKVTANALVDLDNRKLDASAYTPTDLSNYYTKSQTNTQIRNATDSLLDAGEFYEYTGSNDERVGDIEDRLSEDEEVTSAALNELNTALDDKADTSAVTASITAAVSGKQDTLVSGTNIKTINNESLLGSGNIDIQGGGGKAIEAGRGIAITTGATADTVSFDLPISSTTDNSNILLLCGNNSLSSGNRNSGFTIIGYSNIAGTAGSNSVNNSNSTVIGRENNLNGGNTFIAGYKNRGNFNNINVYKTNYSYIIGRENDVNVPSDANNVFIFGAYDKVTKSDEFALGKYNNSVSDGTTSGNTFFSIGNGTSSAATHNAFEIKQNGDIYITKDGSDVKLQDQLGGGGLPESAFTAYTASTEARLAEDEEVTAAALTTLSTALGGFKLVSITQAQYDALTVKDASTLYIITNVVN